MNFRNSSAVQCSCVANTLFLTLEQVFENLSVYRSTFILTGKFFCPKSLYDHRKLHLYHSKEESLRPSALTRYAV